MSSLPSLTAHFPPSPAYPPPTGLHNSNAPLPNASANASAHHHTDTAHHHQHHPYDYTYGNPIPPSYPPFASSGLAASSPTPMPSRASSDGWLEFFDPHKHQFYYYNQQTQVMSWDPPTSLAQQGGAGYTSGYATASAGRSLQPIGGGGGGGGFDGIDGEPSTTFTTKTFESIDSDVGLGGGSGGGVGGYGGHDGGGGHDNRGEPSAQLWSAPPGASGGAGGVGGMGGMGEEVPFHLVGPLLVGHEVGIIMDSTSDQRGAAGEHVDVQRGTVLGFDALSGRHKVRLGGGGGGEGGGGK